MKKSALILFVFILWFLDHGVIAGEISHDTFISGNYILNTDTTVLDGVLLEAYDIKVTDSIHLVNMGTINGNIDISSGCTIELQNAGTFGANVSMQENAHLIQVIKSNDYITDIGLTSGYDVSVRNGENIDFHGVMQIAQNADSIELDNSSFVAGTMSGFNVLHNVEINGDVLLHFDDVNQNQMLLFSGATGNGSVFADSFALDALHLLQTYRVDDDIFVRRIRSTDYARILNNDTGRFLNDLRQSEKDKKLFVHLDRAESVDEINNILSRSVRTNPIKLMRPLQMFYFQKMLEIMHIDDSMTFGLEPIVVRSTGAVISGVRPNVSSVLFDDLYLNLSVYMLNMNYSDSINEYSATSFGGALDAQYNIACNNFVRVHFGANKTMFDVGPVFDGGRVFNNPDGFSMYATGSVGHKFYLSQEYSMSPFVSVESEYVNIAKSQKSYTYIIAGADIEYSYDFDGIKYNYGLHPLVRNDGAIGGGAVISVWSVFDAAGADMHIGAIYDDYFGMSYRASLNGRFRF